MLPERKRSVEDVIADRLERNMAGFPPEFKARVLRVLWLRQLKRMGMTGRQAARALGVSTKTLWRDLRDVRTFASGKGVLPRGYPRAEPEDR
jgi:hypothetical protein